MAGSALSASSTHLPALQIGVPRGWFGVGNRLESWLEAERDQLPLWLPVALGAGIALWFVLPDPAAWEAAGLVALAVALAGVALALHGRAARVVAVGGFAVAIGLGLIWWRAERVAHVVLAEPTIATFTARVERVEPLAARDVVRLRLAPLHVLAVPATRGPVRPLPTLPAHIRVNLVDADVPVGLVPGATLRLSARLMPPPPPGVPGAYDYARTAWFDGIGATGRGFAPITILAGGGTGGVGLRQRLSQHIQASAGGGGVGASPHRSRRGIRAGSRSPTMRRCADPGSRICCR
ncbi:hypothetical protein RGU13_01040 [Sphingomonas sp. 10B4]|nr:DUF4131 domain-containing protein [Sphingomonas sp. 10B4]MDY7522665.1 hypothetical protein [Sphingomonas sp. 10B4]